MNLWVDLWMVEAIIRSVGGWNHEWVDLWVGGSVGNFKDGRGGSMGG